MDDKIRKDWGTFIEAVHSGNVQFVKKFIKCGGDVNYPTEPQSAIHVAVFYGNQELLSELINARGDVNIQDEDGDTPLHTAIGEKKGIAIVEQLLASRADPSIPNDKLHTPIDYTRKVKVRDPSVFTLMEGIMEKNRKLCQAAEQGDLEAVMKIVAEKVDLRIRSEEGITALHEAALAGHAQVVQTLCEHGAAVDVLSTKGVAARSTPLHSACSKGHTEVVKILISKGASLNLKNLEGQTPLHCATANNRFEVVKVLVESSCDVNVLNGGNYTPLHYAVGEGAKEMVQFLISHGALVNAGGTPVTFFAASLGKFWPEIIQILVENGANVNSRSRYGVTLLQLVEEEEKAVQLVTYLKERGATL